jgi:hypothetical protein
MAGRCLLGQWLLHCIDPLGPRPNPPPPLLSSQQACKFLIKADAHRVLPATLRNFRLYAEGPEFSQVRLEADSRRVAALALSTMLNYHADLILAAGEHLPIALVKGRTFARTIYPDAGLRPFTDIDLLVRPDALPQLEPMLLAQGFERLQEGSHPPAWLETQWIHRGTGALVEVHTNLVHMPRMRRAFSLTYEDLETHHQSPAALLTVAITHGAMHYFAWLRHSVDICQAARGLSTLGEEARFEALTARTGTRLAAIVGLTLAYRLIGEPRCLDIAKALGSIRYPWFAKILIRGADLTATSTNWLIYNTWRRFMFRELIRYGASSR